MSLIETIKKCQQEQINQMQLANVAIGVVVGINPLQIDIDQKHTLSEKFFILTRNVTDYQVEMTVEHVTEPHNHTHTIMDTYTGSGQASHETHEHKYEGRKLFYVHQALQVGEKVVLVKAQGGQKYYIMDRLGSD